MADGVVLNSGSGGQTAATDDCGAAGHAQVVKLAISTDGVATLIPADAANGIDVDVTRVGGTVTVDGSAVTQPVSAVSLPLPTGASTAAHQSTQNTALGAIQTAVELLDNTVSGNELQVDVVTLPNVTVGAALPAGDNNIGNVDIVTLPAVTNAGTFAVQENGAALTSLQLIDDIVKTEDAAHGDGDKGVMSLAVRRDANTALVGADGDYAPLQVNADGSLKVAITAGAGSGGTSATDDAAFSVASGSGTPIMGLADETSPDAVDEGDVGVVRMTLSRALHVNLRDASGAELSVGGGTQYTEDAAAAANPVGTALMMVRDDVLSGQTSADGDNIAARGTDKGELYVKHVDAIPVTDNGSSLTVDGTVGVSGTVTVDGSGVTQPVSHAGLTALNGAIAGSEVQVDVVAALPAGTNAIGKLAANSGIDIGDVDVTSVTPGTGASSLGKAEDAAHASGDVGVMALAVRKDAAAASSGADGDYEPLSTDNAGQLRVTVGNTVTVGSHAVTNAGTFPVQVDGAALTALQLIDDVVVTEDAAHSSGDKGVMPLAVRRDANTTLVGTDGDYAPLQVNADGSLKVAITAGAGSGGTSATDDAAFTPASGSGTPIMGFADETSPDSVDEGDVGVVRMTLTRALHVNLRDAAGAEIALGEVTQYDEDAAHASGSKVMGAGIVRKDTAASLAGTDGDYTLPIADASGKLWTNAEITVALPAGTNAIGKLAANSGVDIGDVDVTAVIPGTGATNLGKAEDAAHASGDVGVMALGVRAASPTERSAGPTDGDYEPFATNEVGAVWTTPTPSANGGLSIFRSLDLDETEEEVKG